MPITISKPTVGGDNGVWGTELNTALDALATGALPRQAPRFGWSKIRGGNITVKPGMTGTNPWGQLFVEWDWVNWIKPQVDRAIALGLNAIRLIGAPECVLVAQSNGTITQTQYNAQWAQLADYCLDNGLYLYPCIVTVTDANDVSGGPTGSTLVAAVQSSAVVLAGYANVIGFDLFQEGGSGATAANVLSVMASVRSVAPGVPLTMSHNTADGWDDNSSVSYTVLTSAGGSDFADYHTYVDGDVAANIDYIVSLTGKPILIGEFGDSQDQTSGNQVARYTATSTIHNRPGVLGSLFWALADQSATNTSQFGIWDNTGFSGTFPAASTAPLSTTSGQRTSLTATLPLFNRADPPVAPFFAPNLLPQNVARPVLNAFGWGAADGNTTVAASPAGLVIQATSTGSTSAASVPAAAANCAFGQVVTAKMSAMAAATGRVVTLAIGFLQLNGTFVSLSSATNVTDNALVPQLAYLQVDVPASAARAYLFVTVATGQVSSEQHLERDFWLQNVGAGTVDM